MSNNKISIDIYDLEILKILYDLKKGENITTFSLAKKIFTDSPYNLLKNKDNLIRKRLKKLEVYNLINIFKENNRTFYELQTENCCIRNLRLRNPKINAKIIFLKIYSEWNMFSLY